jgi:hypothetical protein
MITVRWFSSLSKRVEVWRVLDLSGLTKSVRASRGYTLSNFVYVNTNLVTSLKETVEIGRPFRLELRFPNGKTIGKDVIVVNRMYSDARQARSLSPTDLRRKG